MKFRLSLAVALLAPMVPLAAWSQVSVSINFGPPPLLVYAQPAVPDEGYIWTPGYWAWSRSVRAYFWVPGTWVLAPAPGYLWTPGYWAYQGGSYRWNLGYWGTRVGYYGGINYGYGYGGSGYDGGRWNGGVFSYNRFYNNVDSTVVRNVYSTREGGTYRMITTPRVSFNGGPGGVSVRPSAAQLQSQRSRRADPTPVQMEHERAALTTPAQRAATTRGTPQIAATRRPSAFSDSGVVHSRSAAAAPARPAPTLEMRQAPQSAQRAPAPPAAVDRPAPQGPAVRSQPPVRGGEQSQRSAPPPPQVRPEKAAQPQPQQAERGPPRVQSEGRGKEKQREQREEREGAKR